MKLRNILLAIFVFAFACLPCGLYIGCQSVKTAWSAPNRAATAKALEADAVALLGTASTALLQNLAAGNGDFAHSAAHAAWSAFTIPAMADAIRDAGGNDALAANAAALARRAMSTKGATSQDAINAVASAISAGALK